MVLGVLLGLIILFGLFMTIPLIYYLFEKNGHVPIELTIFLKNNSDTLTFDRIED
jgi:hypothetical protein